LFKQTSIPGNILGSKKKFVKTSFKISFDADMTASARNKPGCPAAARAFSISMAFGEVHHFAGGNLHGFGSLPVKDSGAFFAKSTFRVLFIAPFRILSASH
jgi:hypothetical protein